MGHEVYSATKQSIIKACHNKELFLNELRKAIKILLPHQKENLLNWLFFYTADKPEPEKWFLEFLDKNKMVS
ncbi:hypothetical protein [Flavobacterium sedimenticola]|uniref:Uncharacterized protein n=1 Tax=Flavobacterium sedimenticola TaxID=3043286 RepID=A0ABT6XSP8_9FLAO|nr:hypothetical protein [Flavobacterium sedimenticola]MDI9258131.1 hypothetical protein [Flavobacterium sedimenticola]